MEGPVKQGYYKTDFETVNCWALRAAPFAICNLLVVLCYVAVTELYFIHTNL